MVPGGGGACPGAKGRMMPTEVKGFVAAAVAALAADGSLKRLRRVRAAGSPFRSVGSGGGAAFFLPFRLAARLCR